MFLQVVIEVLGHSCAHAQVQFSTFLRNAGADFGGLTVENIPAFLRVPRTQGIPEPQDVYEKHLREVPLGQEARIGSIANNNKGNNTGLDSRTQTPMRFTSSFSTEPN
jgi:hypothetical protein